MSLITNRFRNLVILIALIVTGSFYATTASAGLDAYKLEPIATVDGIAITRYALDDAVATLLPYASLHKSVSERRYEQTRQKALDQLIDIELIFKDAKKRKKAKAPKAEINKRIELIKENLPPGASLEEMLKKSDIGMDGLRAEINKTIVIRMEKDAKKTELEKKSAKTVNKAFMMKYYKNNIEKFKEPKRIRLSNILLKSDPSGGPTGWTKTQDEILVILKEAREGADFAELARKYSQGPSAANGGDMGWTHEGSLLEELDHAASSLKKGEISEPVMTIYGFHLLKLVDATPTVLKKFEDLNQENLKKQLEQKEYKKNHKAWLEGLRKNAKIEILVKDLY
jgi:hypothetical protein